MIRFSLPVLLLLFACASPSREFQAAASRSITLAGDEITVFYTQDRAQAVRTNRRNKSQRVGGMERLVIAMEMVTGCRVRPRSVRGDLVLITASLSCQ